ncbi:hypothetical protein HanRHA438_Chr14g0679441 [Helianthus annuus]|nr:hypothetical protein HanRHA438_Chr14g0679441 [Helianthus annuus]
MTDSPALLREVTGSILRSARVFYYSAFTPDSVCYCGGCNSCQVAGGWKFSRGTPSQTLMHRARARLRQRKPWLREWGGGSYQYGSERPCRLL